MALAYSEENAIQQELVGDDRQGRHRRFLDVTGDGSGSKEMNTTAATYRIKPATTETYVIDEICISAADLSPLAPTGFLGLAALSGGILLGVREELGSSPEIVTMDLLDGLPIKSTIGLMELGESDIIDQTGACAVSTKMRPKIDGRPIRISGTRGESLVCQTQDNMSNLNHLRVSVKLRQYTNL